MARMLAAMASTMSCHVPRPLVLARETGFPRLDHGGLALFGHGSNSTGLMGRNNMRMMLTIDGSIVRGCGLRRCCDGGWRSVGERDSGGGDHCGRQQEDSSESVTVWKNWQMNAVQLREKVSKLGRAGLLAYGLFSGVIYTTFFFIAFLALEKSTGQNPANNLKGCLGGMVTMWTGNNFTRPFRVAGAAAMAPCMDKILKKTQKVFKFEDEASAFLFLVILVFALCGSSVGLLILSRMGK